jgi:hypothetical protein
MRNGATLNANRLPMNFSFLEASTLPITHAINRGGATHGLGSTMARPKIYKFQFL